MDPIGSLVNGMAFALGTVIVSTIAIYIGFRRSSKFMEKILAQIATIWTKVKEEGVTIEGKLKTKKEKRKK